MKNELLRPLKILYVDNDIPWRGGQEQLFSLMQGLKTRGHNITVATPSYSTLKQKAQKINIPTIHFQQSFELSPLAFTRLWKILHKKSFDIIHSNTPTVVLAAGLASKLCGTPMRITSRRVNFPLKSALSRFKYNWTQEQIVTVSNSIRTTLLRCGIDPQKIKVIYEGVDTNWIDIQKPSPLKTKHDLIIGTVAHMSSEKGHNVLLEAAAELIPQFPNIAFVLVGDGKLASALSQQAIQLGIEKNIIFTGFRSDSESLMKNFDIFCLPSLSEGLSSAILVAMANRLPVVATNVGGITELVADKQTGFIVGPKQPSDLASALSKLIQSPNLRNQMGNMGRKRVEEKFTLKNKLDQTERLYYQLLAPTNFD
jgi:glycosyltransferase involved in cell wall biosynthesis